MIRTSTSCSVELPTLLKQPYSTVLSIFSCTSIGTRPISSRKRVPSWASSKRPFRIFEAPVKAPASCPNSSDSRREGGRGRAVYGYIEVFPSGGKVVEPGRGQFLSGSSLAHQKDGTVDPGGKTEFLLKVRKISDSPRASPGRRRVLSIGLLYLLSANFTILFFYSLG